MKLSAKAVFLVIGVSPLGCSIYGADLFADVDGGAGSGGKPGSGGKLEGSGGLGGDGPSTGGVSSGGAGTGATTSGGGTNTGGGGGTLDLIDDLEDFNVTVRYSDKRNGHWDVATDGTGGASTITPVPGFSTPEDVSADPPHTDSNYALHVAGSGFTTWGASLNVSLLASGAYDASKYTGVAFWAKAGASAVKNVAVRLVSGDTDPRGGVCKETGPTNELCYDHFYTDVTLTSEWKYFEVPFSDFHQKSAGMQFPEIDTAEAYGFEFFFGQGQTFELWLDDFAFTSD